MYTPFFTPQRTTYSIEKGHLVSEVPSASEQSYQQSNHRSQLLGHEAPKAQTIATTARLAGFEIEEHNHVPLRLLHEGPLR
jgi:hypothetical protein